MKVIVLNGSPKGENSNTMILTKQFIEGLNSVNNNSIELIDLSKKSIQHCLGCFLCWKKRPYRCVINDDVDDILKLFVNAELIIWSFPLYHYGMPSKMKAFLDRTLPLSVLFSNIRKGSYYGILNNNTKHIIISTCGAICENSYSSVDEMFKLSYGEENLEKIYLMGGEAISYLENPETLTNYLKNVKEAGIEYSKFGKFSDSTKESLQKCIFDDKAFDVEKWLN